MDISSKISKVKNYRKISDSEYQLQAAWTSSDMVEMNNGNSLEKELENLNTDIDNKLSALETNIDWKETVETYDDIATIYPNPEDGWTVNTKDNNITYRYNGSEWVAISANAIPKATNEVDGLMTKEYAKKLDGLTEYTPDGTTITADEDGTLHGVKVTVDDALSPTSTNPVQNKVIKAYVDKKASENVDFSTSTSKLLNDTVEAPLVLNKATKNLLNPTLLSIAENDLKDSGITAKINSDGSITLNGTATRSIWSVLYTTYGSGKNNMFEGLRVFSNLNYNESGAYGELYIAYCRDNDGRQETWRSGHDGDLIPDGNGEPCWVRLHITSGATFNNETFFIMLTDDEEGAVNDKLIPYSGYDIKTCGKNLLDLKNKGKDTYTSTGMTYTKQSDGSYKRIGTSTETPANVWLFGKYQLSPDGTNHLLTLKKGHTYYVEDCALYSLVNGELWFHNPGIFTLSQDVYVTGVREWGVDKGTTYNDIVYPRIFEADHDLGWEPYVESTAHIDSSTEFPLLGLKSFDDITNIISPGNVEVTYAKSDSGAAILDTSEKFVKDARKETTVNLLNLTLQTTTQNGVTCTNNGDGTYTLNGTATKEVVFNFLSSGIGKSLYKNTVGKTLKFLNGGAINPPVGRFIFTLRDGNKWWPTEQRNNSIFTVPEGYVETIVDLHIYKDQTVTDLIVKPMLTTNLNATYDDFVPYTGDGETLASDVAEIKNDLGGLSFSASGTTLTITDGTNTWTLGANS